MVVLSLSVFASAASANDTNHDAGWKIRGLRDAPARNYQPYRNTPSYSANSYAAPVGRRSFSYAPGAATAATPVPVNGYRSYSAAPGGASNAGCCCR
jgi:hypothetical protein